MSKENDSNQSNLGKPRVAGRELDAEIAEKVMGIGPACWCGPMPDSYNTETGECLRCGRKTCPWFSTEIAAAWQVVEKLAELVKAKGYGSLFIMPYMSEQCSGHKWCVKHSMDGYNGSHALAWWVSAYTAPLAICLAALAVVEAK